MQMARINKIIGFSVRPLVVEEYEQLAKEERRSKSGLFLEMLRVYKRYRQQKEQEEDRWIMNLIREAKEEQATNPMTQEELIKEDQRLMRYGQKRAKETGLTEKDIIREIHAYRAERKS